MDTALNTFEFVKLFSLGYFARPCLWRKAWTVCEPQKSSECYPRQLAWCWHQTARIKKNHVALRKASSSNDKGKQKTYSAHSLLISWLIIRPTVTFWRSLRTSSNENDEPLAKIALW